MNQDLDYVSLLLHLIEAQGVLKGILQNDPANELAKRNLTMLNESFKWIRKNYNGHTLEQTAETTESAVTAVREAGI